MTDWREGLTHKYWDCLSGSGDMITSFLIGAVIVAAGWAFLAFGRNWFGSLIQQRRAKKGGCQ